MVPDRGANGTADGGQMVPPKSQKGAFGTTKGGKKYYRWKDEKKRKRRSSQNRTISYAAADTI